MITGGAKGIGTGQNYADVTASRAFNVTYTNTKGKPILVMFLLGSGSCSVIVDGVNLGAQSGTMGYRSFIVPPNKTYSLTTGGAPTLTTWVELS